MSNLRLIMLDIQKSKIIPHLLIECCINGAKPRLISNQFGQIRASPHSHVTRVGTMNARVGPERSFSINISRYAWAYLCEVTPRQCNSRLYYRNLMSADKCNLISAGDPIKPACQEPCFFKHVHAMRRYRKGQQFWPFRRSPLCFSRRRTTIWLPQHPKVKRHQRHCPVIGGVVYHLTCQ